MDLVKTVLLYLMMIVSTATSVSPDVTPIPASQVSTPAPYVTATPDPQSLITAAPTAAPTQARYITLILNDEGSNVRRLQRRLVELGYLEEGDVDGKYGAKTKRAVENFQRRNELRVDGIAGSQTQQMMFESPNVIYYNSSTPTPVPTQTPIPYVSVPVYYVDAASNTVLSTATASCFASSYIYADNTRVPAGYTLVSNSPVQVTVRNGVASPSSVTFRYQGPVIAVDLPVYYVDDNNQTIAQSSVRMTSSGYVYADSSILPSGYVFSSNTSYYVTVANGNASASMIVFKVSRSATATPQRVRTVVTVQYLDSLTGRLLYQTTVTMYSTSAKVTARDDVVPSGYSLVSERSVNVYVSNGVADPAVVQFFYTNPSVTATPGPSVDVPIYYIDDTTSRILVRDSILLNRSTRVYRTISKIPSGYSLTGSSYVDVTLSNGVANPASIVFRVARNATPTPVPTAVPPAYVDVVVRYRYGSTTVYSTSISCRVGQSRVIYADSSVYSPNYVLSPSAANSQTVRVSADGVASPSMVTFYLTKPTPTATPIRYVDVPVRYMYGERLINATTVSCQVGRYTTVSADSSMYPSTYVISGSSRVSVSVSSLGSVSPSIVIFDLALRATATPTAVPVFTVDVPVRYVYNNSVIATEYVACQNARTTVINANTALFSRDYLISGSSTANVYVSQNGSASPSVVTFYLARRATQAPTAVPSYPVNVPVRYMCDNMAVVLGAVECYTGQSTVVEAEPGLYQDEYVLTSARTVNVIVSNEGVARPSEVVFQLSRKATPAPTDVPVVQVEVPVEYVCGSEVVYEYNAVCYSNQDNVVYADPAVYGNVYQLSGPDRQKVTVSKDGTASPSLVIFYLEQPSTPAPTAVPSFRIEVPVRYMNGNQVIFEETARCMNDGVTEVTANMSRFEGQYTLDSADRVSVRVSADGRTVDPSVIIFYLTPAYQPEPDPVPENDSSAEQSAIQALYQYLDANRRSDSSSESHTEPAVSGNMNVYLPTYLTGKLGNTPLAVYQGPGTQYLREENGKASYNGGTARIYGTDGDWLLIGYMLGETNYRIGYVQGYALPSKYSPDDIPQLSYSYAQMKTTDNAKVTTDTVMTSAALETLPAGTTVTFLAYQDIMKKWAFVEYVSPNSGKRVRGFISTRFLAQ